MLVSRRIIREEKTKQGKEKSIEYEDMESILFYNMGRWKKPSDIIFSVFGEINILEGSSLHRS